MIKLLEKYEAYAPPFKYEPAAGGEPYIGGIMGRVPYDEGLLQSLQAAWTEANTKMVTKQWEIPSAHRVGVFYVVRKLLGGFVCTCPARGGCWHIKVAKQLDLDEDQDVLDLVKRENDYKDGV